MIYNEVRVGQEIFMVPIEARKNATQSPKVREASFEDYPGIVSLESRYGLESKTYDEWKRLWIDNPIYIELQHRWPIGWVLENDRQILGYFGNIPLSYELRGRKIIVATGRAWVVDARYRGYSVLLLHHFLYQQYVDLYLDTTANSEAARAFSAFGGSRVPVGRWDRSACWITNYRGFLSNWLTRKVSPSAKSISYPLSAVLFLKDILSRKALRGDQTGAEVRLCTSFDDRFDVFWEELRRENSHVLLAVRTQEALEWHFKPALLQNRVWTLTIRNASRLVAYSIFLRRDNARSGVKGVLLVDFQALGGHADFLLPMFSWALRRCQDEGIHLLVNVGLCFGKSNINKLAPYQRKWPSWSYFYKARDKSLAETLSNPEVWAPSLFDGDGSL